MAKNTKKKEKKEGGKKHKSLLWLFGAATFSVALLLFCQFYFGDTVTDNTVFYDGTTINGIDVSGLTQAQAQNVVSAKMLEGLQNVQLTLTYGEQKWTYSGGDFEINPDISQQMHEMICYGREGNIIEKTKLAKKIKKEGLALNIPYSDIMTGFDNKIDEISSQVDRPPIDAQVVFSPDQAVAFSVQESQSGIKVDKARLNELLKEQFAQEELVEIELPIVPVLPEESQEMMLEKIALRSSFKTNYSSSSPQRKANVALALSKFNGMVVAPDQEVSFNATTGQRSEENGYKKANIIKNGVFVEGNGGGVCQASTTLYNGLVLAGIDIEEVHNHSLPVSYVPLSMDAMVSEGYADLVFKNTTGAPIYIKTFVGNNEVGVEIYGAQLDEGESLAVRSELVKIIPHAGDKIVTDYSGQYDNFVLYKGEYHRIKYPKEGYETKAFLQHIKDGKVQSEEMIRHDFYWPQEGVVVEGSEELGYGMTLPKSNVTLIPAQTVTDSHFENMKKQFDHCSSAKYEA